MIEKDPRNKDVLFPYLNGDDLNNDPEQKPSRWVINFFDWDEEKAKTYPDCYEIVERLVKPERMKLDADKSSTNKKRKTYWWQYGSDAKSLYNTISGLEQVMVIARTSKTVAFTFVSVKQVLNANLTIIGTDKFSDLAILQSTIHNIWAWKHTTKLKSDLIYQPVDIFETFPFPQFALNELDVIGRKYFELRRNLMNQLKIGLTKIYNLIHSKGVVSKNKNDKIYTFLCKQIEKIDIPISIDDFINAFEDIRKLQVEMDEVVLKSYGWDDIKLHHSFYELEYLPANDNVRYTIHPTPRKEILKRLLELNNERYKAEKGEHLSTNSPKRLRKKDNNNSSNLLF